MTARPTIVAHRGASGYLPEHTLAAYELGARMGADAVELDVVMTRDGHLVARHENDITHSTDVVSHPEFADRQATKTVDGLTRTGWFTEDFTLEELRRLRAIETLPQVRSGEHDGHFPIASLADVLGLRAALAAELGRRLEVKLEVKCARYFRELGLPMEEPLVSLLESCDLLGADAPVEVMSFEWTSLKLLREHGVANGMVFLVDAVGGPPDLPAGRAGARTFAGFLTPAGLAEVATVATAIGPGKSLLFPPRPDGSMGEPAALFAAAHAAGLRVDCWTFRAENAFLPADLRRGQDPAAYGDLGIEVTRFVDAGLNTVITDHPDRVLAAL